ncbi:MAG: hypothetical protein ACRCW5_09585 [Cetobacterium sp.]|uniref:hypothetical protein n=1 Tax=Cetobacterium sp. TaxID=2071632 RepID=UPI003F3BFAE9
MLTKLDFELSLKNDERNICPTYECCCDKEWKNLDRLIVKYVYKNIEETLINLETDTPLEYLDKICNYSREKLSGNLIIAGAHTVINLKDRLLVSNEVVKSADFAMQIIANINNKFNNIDFLIPLNDFFMEKKESQNENNINFYRDQCLKSYVIPTLLKNSLKDIKNNCYYCSEKNMADKFKRHIKNIKKNNDLFYNYGDNNEHWGLNINNKNIEIINNNKPNCVAGNAATFRDINYTVNNRKKNKNYDSHIGIYPLCSMNNVINGYKVANSFYEIDLPTILIFFEKKCF